MIEKVNCCNLPSAIVKLWVGVSEKYCEKPEIIKKLIVNHNKESKKLIMRRLIKFELRREKKNQIKSWLEKLIHSIRNILLVDCLFVSIFDYKCIFWLQLIN